MKKTLSLALILSSMSCIAAGTRTEGQLLKDIKACQGQLAKSIKLPKSEKVRLEGSRAELKTKYLSSVQSGKDGIIVTINEPKSASRRWTRHGGMIEFNYNNHVFSPIDAATISYQTEACTFEDRASYTDRFGTVHPAVTHKDTCVTRATVNPGSATGKVKLVGKGGFVTKFKANVGKYEKCLVKLEI